MYLNYLLVVIKAAQWQEIQALHIYSYRTRCNYMAKNTENIGRRIRRNISSCKKKINKQIRKANALVTVFCYIIIECLGTLIGGMSD